MSQDFKAGQVFRFEGVWENSLKLLLTYGITTPNFVKRLISSKALNLLDPDLFRKNHQNWKFNGVRYQTQGELVAAQWFNYSGTRVYKTEFLERINRLLAWKAIVRVREEDLGDERLILRSDFKCYRQVLFSYKHTEKEGFILLFFSIFFRILGIRSHTP